MVRKEYKAIFEIQDIHEEVWGERVYVISTFLN
jgi:hypothetical protein